MTAEVVVASVDGRAADLVELLTWSHLRTVPVVDTDGQLVGVVSDTDLVDLVPVGRARTGRPREWRYVSRQHRVGALMRPAVTVAPDVPVGTAVRRMTTAQVSCLPVVADGRLVGVVTAHDLLTARRADDVIRDEVAALLERYLPSLRADTDISVEAGVVTLSGEIPAASTIGLAVHLARHVDGVVRVVDDLHPTGYALASARDHADADGKRGARFSRNAATPSSTSGPMNVSIS